MATVTGLKSERTELRKRCTRISNDLVKLMVQEGSMKDIKFKRRQLEDRFERLFELDKRINGMMLENEEEYADELENEMNGMEEYRDKYLFALNNYEEYCDSEKKSATPQKQGEASCAPRMHLPQLQLSVFDGDVKNWLSFWGTFQGIDEDDSISEQDKLRYLHQATSGQAKELVKSYPNIPGNYKKALDHLQERYAKRSYLIEIYFRELLQLVLNKYVSKKDLSLVELVNQLEIYLRALQTLGATSDQYEAMLYPLVESSLPTDLLRVWERQRRIKKNNLGSTQSLEQGDDRDDSNKLDQLMGFLRCEVDSEVHINLTRSSFNVGVHTKIKSEPKGEYQQPTAAVLLNQSNTGKVQEEKQTKKDICLFCEKESHLSQNCIKNMTLAEKREILKKSKACFNCLRVGHQSRNCKNSFVKCLICKHRHFVIMCPTLEKPTKEEIVENACVVVDAPKIAYLQTLVFKAIVGDRVVCVRALMDSGCSKSYIKKLLLDQLGAKPKESIVLNHGLFGGKSQKTTHKLYSITICDLKESFKLEIEILDQDKLCQSIPVLNDSNVLLKLKNDSIMLSDVESQVEEIGCIFGADMIPRLLTGEVRRVTDSLIALNTKLGWTIMGTHSSISNANLVESCSFISVGNNIEDFWSLEKMGIYESIDTPSDRTLDHFKNTVKLNGEGRYEVSLPWKDGHVPLPHNYNMAKDRLISTTKKLLSKEKFVAYNEVFNQWESDGIIETVTDDQLEGHYLPHHAVIKESSNTTKIRPVFDASAKKRGHPALNDCLEKGPNLIHQIMPLINKFRREKYGITADIQQAFLQVSLNPEERKYFKFLWWVNSDMKKIKTFRHCRVVFGVAPSPFFLSATINHHLDSVKGKLRSTAKILKHSFYVDNLLHSVKSLEELKLFKSEAQLIMLQGKFNLREWNFTTNLVEESVDPFVSCLGMIWDKARDTLHCEPKIDGHLSMKLTKREVLSITQRVYDPVGIVCPVTIVPKLLLQELWLKNITWDEELPWEIRTKFENWMKYTSYISRCKIPRWLKSDCTGEFLQIHVFCDASKHAYAGCVFLRSGEENQINLQLIQAKSRIAPISKGKNRATIPRLELMSAMMAARLYKSVVEPMQWNHLPCYFWSDSLVALTWIVQNENWNVFIRNRVREIRELTPVEAWRHVPGAMNIADLPSRGCHAKHLFESVWWEGPNWLRQSEEMWPNTISEFKAEGAYNEKLESLNCLNYEDSKLSLDMFKIYLPKFSFIVRIISWIFRFMNNSLVVNKKTDGNLAAEELKHGENVLIKRLQADHFDEEFFQKRSNCLRTFYDKNGVIRVRTRLTNKVLSEDFKCPVLLPDRNDFVRALVLEEHLRNSHAGINILVSVLREKWWIIRSRKLVRNVVHGCVTCRRFAAAHIQVPTGLLPEDRTKLAKCFSTTGIDLAGPLMLKEGKGWVVLFTCATYRGIHLELVMSLSTEAFFEALRRFIARRGRPSTIYCDHGSNFVGAKNELAKIDWSEICNNSTFSPIVWKFIPPCSPWWGGWWERMVRIVKELLRRVLGRSKVTYQQMVTILCDIESVINKRPLTYVTEDDEFIPLTPIMFMQDIDCVEIQDVDQVTHNDLKQKLKFIQSLRESLRLRFKNEYLSQLVHLGHTQKSNAALKVGDIVLIGCDNTKRISWPIGLIEELIEGKDGFKRLAKLRTANGCLLRPLQRLYPFELNLSNQNKSKSGRVLKVPQKLSF